jgi:putative transposase
MPRTARFIELNGFYHIISRSLNDTRIFRDNDDFKCFIQLILIAKNKYPIRIFHYAIMNTHFHLAIQTTDHQTLSQNIACLKWHYTLWMRKKYNWKGPLWRERYKSLPIENEGYLYACGMYIEYNPVRAGICGDPADYPYSSYRKYNSQINDTLIDNYEINNNPKQPIQLDYCSDIAKIIFSFSPCIGSNSYIKKLKYKCLSQK